MLWRVMADIVVAVHATHIAILEYIFTCKSWDLA
jgi:hypothetical protein